MQTIYLFQAIELFEHEVFDALIKEIIPETEIVYEDAKSGYFIADSKFEQELEASVFSIHQALDVRLSVLCVHRRSELSEYCRKGSLDYFPNQCTFISDVLFKRTSFGDFYFVHPLKHEFQDVPDDVLETVGAFLRSGMNGLDTAKALHIHRNTFNYRLNEFIKITDLDIRDYHNALVLELYFQFVRRH